MAATIDRQKTLHRPATHGRSLTLLVARTSGKRVIGGQVAVADDALAALRESVEHAREAHATRTAQPYDPDGALEAEEYFYVSRADVEDSMKVLELLDRAVATVGGRLQPAVSGFGHGTAVYVRDLEELLPR